MAGSKVVSCVGPSYHLEDTKSAIQSAINCYPQMLDQGNGMMQSIPGEVTLVALPAAIRNQCNVLGRWFVVAGSVLYEQATDGTYINRGSLGTSSGFVGMDYNQNQLAIVDGPNLYIFNLLANTLTQIISDGWRGSDDVHELDGYFIFVAPGTDQFYISAIDDGTSLDALDFSSADSSPDNIVGHRVSHRQAWFFGDLSTEIWINTGEISFPFARYQSYTLDVGCVGKRAAINAADTLFWIGKTERGTGIVYMAQGNQPSRVSTMAVEEALRGSTDISQATMWTYQIEGHEFIGINAPGLKTTWVYDAANQQWHERGEWLDGWQPLRSRLYVSVGQSIYGGDDQGNIVRLDASVNNLSGRVLVRERTWPHMIGPAMEPISFYSLELMLRTGYGGDITLQISNDTGATFGTPLIKLLGAIGRRMERIRWHALGISFNRVFRIRCSADVPFALYSAVVKT